MNIPELLLLFGGERRGGDGVGIEFVVRAVDDGHIALAQFELAAEAEPLLLAPALNEHGLTRASRRGLTVHHDDRAGAAQRRRTAKPAPRLSGRLRYLQERLGGRCLQLKLPVQNSKTGHHVSWRLFSSRDRKVLCGLGTAFRRGERVVPGLCAVICASKLRRSDSARQDRVHQPRSHRAGCGRSDQTEAHGGRPPCWRPHADSVQTAERQCRCR